LDEVSGTGVPGSISGRLPSEGSGVAGATIIINCDEEECDTADTDSGGHYSVAASLNATEPKSTHTIEAQHLVKFLGKLRKIIKPIILLW
jgi:hypothetical protein